MKKKMFKSGFTLIELMIVVAIIGVLAAIALPKFADLVIKSKESAIKGSLGSLRSAVTIYYADMEGMFPATGSLTSSLTTGSKYLKEIPFIQIPRHGNHANTNSETDSVTDVGGWFYSGSSEGHVVVNCTHADLKSSVWSTW